MANLIPAPHPGETIREDVLEPLGMSVNQLAKALGITATRLNDVVRGRRGITADTALRLARYLGTSAEFWLGLQLEYDLRTTRQARQREIEKAVQPRSAAAELCLRRGSCLRTRNLLYRHLHGTVRQGSNRRHLLQPDLRPASTGAHLRIGVSRQSERRPTSSVTPATDRRHAEHRTSEPPTADLGGAQQRPPLRKGT